MTAPTVEVRAILLIEFNGNRGVKQCVGGECARKGTGSFVAWFPPVKKDWTAVVFDRIFSPAASLSYVRMSHIDPINGMMEFATCGQSGVPATPPAGDWLELTVQCLRNGDG